MSTLDLVTILTTLLAIPLCAYLARDTPPRARR